MYFNQIRIQLGGETALISIQGGQILQESSDKSLKPLANDKVCYNFFLNVNFCPKMSNSNDRHFRSIVIFGKSFIYGRSSIFDRSSIFSKLSIFDQSSNFGQSIFFGQSLFSVNRIFSVNRRNWQNVLKCQFPVKIVIIQKFRKKKFIE